MSRSLRVRQRPALPSWKSRFWATRYWTKYAKLANRRLDKAVVRLDSATSDRETDHHSAIRLTLFHDVQEPHGLIGTEVGNIAIARIGLQRFIKAFRRRAQLFAMDN